MFERFLESSAVYAQCYEFWSHLVQATAIEQNQQGHWIEWLPKTYPNGSPVPKDGNPIFGVWNKTLNRAFRIIQEKPNASEIDCSVIAWVKKYEGVWEIPMPEAELFISLQFSEATQLDVKKIIVEWMKTDNDPDRISEIDSISRHF